MLTLLLIQKQSVIRKFLLVLWLLFHHHLRWAQADCPPIYTPLNGNLVGQFENQCKTVEGSVCRVNCNFSYKLIGDFERVCSNGQWSGYEPFCVGNTKVHLSSPLFSLPCILIVFAYVLID
jgi:hypothetical protein